MTQENKSQASSLPLDRRLEIMLSITSQLSDLLKNENIALKDHKIKTVAKFVPMKDKLTVAYQEIFKSFEAHKDAIKTLPEKKKEVLKKASTSLQKLMTENARLLKANVEANKRVVQAIISAVKEEGLSKTHYGSSGKMARINKANASVSFNEVL